MSTDRPDTTRRRFVPWTAGVAGIVMATGFVACGAEQAAEAQRERVPVGVQLYSVRHELAEDVAPVLDRLAEMGFEGVEFADYFGRSAAELRALLDERGLRCAGTHVYMHDLEDAAFDETVAFARTLGCRDLVIRWIPEERRDSHDAFLQTAAWFDEVAARLAPHGMRVGYHSHSYAFEVLDGETLWDVLARNTRGDVVLQLDSGPASLTGNDVVELVRRYPGRTATMHVKAYSVAEPAAFLGADEIDWPAVVDAAERVGGIEWYILEYEIEGVPPLDALEASLAYFRSITQ